MQPRQWRQAFAGDESHRVAAVPMTKAPDGATERTTLLSTHPGLRRDGLMNRRLAIEILTSVCRASEDLSFVIFHLSFENDDK